MIDQRRILSDKKVKTIILTPFLILVLMAFITLYPGTRDFGIWLLAENKPVELLTFVIFIIGSVYGMKFSFNISKNHKYYIVLFYGVFSFFLFFIAMEEIAWGQQFFDFKTPTSWKKINLQGETTLHNIEGLQGKSEIFRLLFGLGGIFGIWLDRFSLFNDISPSKILWSWFIVITIHAGIDLYADTITINEFYDRGLQRTSELIELLIAMSSVLYLWLNKKKLLEPQF